MWETGQDRQDQGATSKSLRPVCRPWMVGQALDTRSLPASDATSLPSSATLGVGKQWGYSGDELVQIPALPLTSYEAFSKFCHFSRLHFPPVETCNLSELG